MTTSRRIALVLTVAGLFLAPRPVSTASAERALTARVPAAALTHLDLTTLDGIVSVTADANPAATDVGISVTVEPAAARSGHKVVPVQMSDVAIDWKTTGNVLRVGLANAAEGSVETHWTVTVPARFSARVNAHDGDVTIDGVAGGVTASVNAGLRGSHGVLTVDVPKGQLALSMGVGTIRATRRSADFGNAVAKSTVGDASLFLLGHEIVAPHAPGPGHRVSLDGKGGDTLSVSVSVGDVSLKIG